MRLGQLYFLLTVSLTMFCTWPESSFAASKKAGKTASKAASRKKTAKFPIVQTSLGSVVEVKEFLEVKNRSAEAQVIEFKLKPGQILKDRAVLRSGAESQARLQLSAENFLILMPMTDLEIPAIHWEAGKIDSLFLNSGSIRLVCKSECDLRMRTKIFDEAVGSGDFIISYNEKEPSIRVEVLDGEINFRGLENETQVLLKSGEQAEFKGQFENGEVAYDTLLRGRKVARGQMTPVLKIPKDRQAKLWLEEEKFHKKEKAIQKAKSRSAEQICDQPWGRLNECAYQCVRNSKAAKICDLEGGAKCIRKRCNANGLWADETILGAQESQCEMKDVVKPCDY